MLNKNKFNFIKINIYFPFFLIKNILKTSSAIEESFPTEISSFTKKKKKKNRK
jgi:hypothetical protein